MPAEQTYATTQTVVCYAPFEVVIHNQPTDCWLSLLGRVLNVTPLVQEYSDSELVKPLLAFAGKNVSVWFDVDTGDLQHWIHPITGVRVPYCPHGRIPHVERCTPTADWRELKDSLPWWRDDKYVIGTLTKKVRPLRIINTEIGKEYNLNVCCEDTINRIMERYSIFNSNASSYCWKYAYSDNYFLTNNYNFPHRFNGKRLKMNQTLEENGIPDERDEFTRLGLPGNLYIPGIFLYYMDDFKWMTDD